MHSLLLFLIIEIFNYSIFKWSKVTQSNERGESECSSGGSEEAKGSEYFTVTQRVLAANQK